MNIKPSQEVLENKIAQKERFVRELEKFRVLSEGGKSEFWKYVKKIVQVKLDFTEASLDGYQKVTEVERIGFLECRKNMRFFLMIPEDFSSGLKDLNNKISELDKDINAYGSKLKRQ